MIWAKMRRFYGYVIKKFIGLVAVIIVILPFSSCDSNTANIGISEIASEIKEDDSAEITDKMSGESENISVNFENSADDSENKVTLTLNGIDFSAVLYDNETAKAFYEKLPMNLEMKELNGNEIYCYLPFSLTTENVTPKQINIGDIMLYGDDCIVIFYDSFVSSYSYTQIGYIMDTEGLSEACKNGRVTVKIKNS